MTSSNNSDIKTKTSQLKIKSETIEETTLRHMLELDKCHRLSK